MVVFALIALLGVALGDVTPSSTNCKAGINHLGGDLPDMPIFLPAADPELCKAHCDNTTSCAGFVYHAPFCNQGNPCTHPNGCCYLKATITGPTPNSCSCASGSPDPRPEPRPVQPFNRDHKNVLYILVDDLRPELPGPFGQDYIHAPNIAKLATEGTTFVNAYCQQAVCSPSRMSFLSGRRPDHTKAFNFINHIRQADCGAPDVNVLYHGHVISNLTVVSHKGGSGQCCTFCTEDKACQAWSYNILQTTCLLFANVTGREPNVGFLSSYTGVYNTANWTTHPQHYYLSGYHTASSGKIFHTEEGGTGPAPWIGEGMPPNQDPPSWSPTASMQEVNAVAPMWGCADTKIQPVTNCQVNATIEGNVLDGDYPLCDKTIGDDAVQRLGVAMQNKDSTGQPFFMAVGFRKPHLAFRFPAPWMQHYPNVSDIKIAAHPTLDPSVPPIASHNPCLQGPSPYIALPTATAQQLRQYYYTCVSWMDSQVGRVLDLLEAGGHKNDTLVVFHSDHGWSLGEHGSWEKFTEFETGTRVPLIIRAPWLEQARNQVSHAMVELVDIYPTTIDLTGVGPVPNETLDGISLGPILLTPGSSVKNYSLSQYPRCPQDLSNVSNYWQDNNCLFTDRAEIPFMGYSIRIEGWRYTEWVEWNGAELRPEWSKQVGRELYDHHGDNELDFDAFENVNVADDNPDVVAELAALLHEAIATQ